MVYVPGRYQSKSEYGLTVSMHIECINMLLYQSLLSYIHVFISFT